MTVIYSKEAECMYVLRLRYRGGFGEIYRFHNAGQAKEAYDTCRVAHKNKAVCEIYDEGGQLASIDGADLMSVQNVDVGAEGVATMKLTALLSGIEQEFAPKRGPDSITVARQTAPAERMQFST